jgi:exosortase
LAAGAACLLAPLVALFAPVFAALVRVWRLDPNYSHGGLVAAASLFFAWRAWRRDGVPWRSEVPRADLLWGGAVGAVGLAVHLAAAFVGMLLLDVLALVAVLRGMLLVLGGRPAANAYGFACLFLVFMAPLPIAWYQPLANVMQQAATSISGAMLTGLGAPVFVQGYVFHVPGHTLELAEACSGLRQLTAFLAMGVAVAHFSGRTLWFKTALVAASALAAIAANCVRVVAAVLVLWLAGPRWAEGTLHAVEGLVVVGLGLLMLIGAAWILSRLEDRLTGASFPGTPPCAAGG